MPESLNARPVASLLQVTLVTLAATLSSCHVFVEQAEKNLQASPSPGLALSSAGNAPIRRFTPSTEHLKFEVDPTTSTGSIDLAIDHDSLAPRRSVCECPLKGSITATLRTSGSGKRSLTLEKIELVTAGRGELEFVWSPLIGTIRMVIPGGLLTITDNSPDPVINLSANGHFSHPGYKFQVGGTGQVETTGLVLRRKIGNTETDLTIEETEQVTLAGTLTRKEGRWHLDLPGTILKDQFEVDEEGTTLDLIFTSNIASYAK